MVANIFTENVEYTFEEFRSRFLCCGLCRKQMTDLIPPSGIFDCFHHFCKICHPPSATVFKSLKCNLCQPDDDTFPLYAIHRHLRSDTTYCVKHNPSNWRRCSECQKYFCLLCSPTSYEHDTVEEFSNLLVNKLLSEYYDEFKPLFKIHCSNALQALPEILIKRTLYFLQLIKNLGQPDSVSLKYYKIQDKVQQLQDQIQSQSSVSFNIKDICEGTATFNALEVGKETLIDCYEQLGKVYEDLYICYVKWLVGGKIYCYKISGLEMESITEGHWDQVLETREIDDSEET